MRNNWKQSYEDLLGIFESQKKRMRELEDEIEILKFENIALQDAKMDSMLQASEKPSDCSLDVVSKSPFNCKCDNKHKIAEREFYYSAKLDKNISRTLLICLKCGEHHYITD